MAGDFRSCAERRPFGCIVELADQPDHRSELGILPGEWSNGSMGHFAINEADSFPPFFIDAQEPWRPGYPRILQMYKEGLDIESVRTTLSADLVSNSDHS